MRVECWRPYRNRSRKRISVRYLAQTSHLSQKDDGGEADNDADRKTSPTQNGASDLMRVTRLKNAYVGEWVDGMIRMQI